LIDDDVMLFVDDVRCGLVQPRKVVQYAIRSLLLLNIHALTAKEVDHTIMSLIPSILLLQTWSNMLAWTPPAMTGLHSRLQSLHRSEVRAFRCS
jgi:hypothetical protein